MVTAKLRAPSRAFTLASGALGVASLILWELVFESNTIPLRALLPVVVGVAAVAAGFRAGAIAWVVTALYAVAASGPAGPLAGDLSSLVLSFVSLAGMAYSGAFWHQQGRLHAALLRHANERLATVIREAPLAIYGVDSATDIVRHWNPAAERLLGWTASEVLGRPFPSVPDDTREQRREMLTQLLAGQHVLGLETQRLHKDGLRRDVTLSVSPLQSHDGEGIEMLAFGEDITERKRTERALHQALSELFAIVNDTPVAIYTVDAGSDAVKLWNPAAERLFGWPADEVLGRQLPTVPPEYIEGRRRLIERLMQGTAITDREVMAVRRDGSRVDVSLSMVLLPGSDGGADDILTFAVDITARRQAEHGRQRALSELSALLDNSPVAIHAVDGETDLVKYWNPAAQRLFGWSADEVVGKPLPVVPAEMSEFRRAMRERVFAGQSVTDVEVEALRKDGSFVELSLSYGLVPSAEGGVGDVLSFSVDITARKEVQRQLQQSQQQYQQLVESATDVVYQADVTGRFTFVNSVAVRLTGRSEKELMGLRFSELVHPDYVRQASRFYYRQYGGRVPVTYYEFPLVRANGETVWVGQNVQLTFSESGEPQGFQAIVRDISELRTGQEALATQYAAAEYARAEVRAMLDATIDTMIFVGTDMRVRAVNRAYYSQIGAAQSQDFLGKHIQEFEESLHVLFENGDELFEMVSRTLQHATGHETVELRQLQPEHRVLLVSSTPVVTPGGEFMGRLFLFRDVTEERALERTKDHLLSMVSHELRTPLASIMGYTELLLSDAEEPPSARQTQFLNVVMESTNHQLELVNDLLDISHLNEGMVLMRPALVNMAEAVETTARSLRPQADVKAITVTVDAPAHAMVHADLHRVEQVVRNLLSNGIKYTPQGGAVTVRLTQLANNVRCEVSDTGIGMSEDEQAQVFTRFFRAPAAVRAAFGSGLGLAIAKALVELQGGEIGFSSQLGQGSTFWFTLPAVAPTPGASQSEANPPARPLEPAPTGASNGPSGAAAPQEQALTAAARQPRDAAPRRKPAR